MSSCKLLHQSGSVLMITVLFLLALTLLAINALEVALLETKMSANFSFKVSGMQAADAKLIQDENALLQGKKVKDAEIISTAICGVTMYRITVNVLPGLANTKVQSTFAKVGDISHCDPKPVIQEGRQSWLAIN